MFGGKFSYFIMKEFNTNHEVLKIQKLITGIFILYKRPTVSGGWYNREATNGLHTFLCRCNTNNNDRKVAVGLPAHLGALSTP